MRANALIRWRRLRRRGRRDLDVGARDSSACPRTPHTPGPGDAAPRRPSHRRRSTRPGPRRPQPGYRDNARDARSVRSARRSPLGCRSESARELGFRLVDRLQPLDPDTRAHGAQLVGVAQTVVEDALMNPRAPLRLVISTAKAACRSVGKPGKGSVWISTARNPAPGRTSMRSRSIQMSAPASRSLAVSGSMSGSRTSFNVTSPPVITAPMAKVPPPGGRAGLLSETPAADRRHRR